MKRIISLIFLIALMATGVFAQTTVTNTTLGSAITTTSGQNIQVASATGFSSAVSSPTVAFVDGELMDVKGVNGTNITVIRGYGGTNGRTHLSGAQVWVGPPNAFGVLGLSGSCTAANTFSPTFNVRTGDRFQCINGFWQKTYDATFTYPQTVFVTGNAYTNATTTFSTVIGSTGVALAFSIDANKSYAITCRILWQGSAATTGPKYQFTGPSSPTAVAANALSAVTATTITQASATAFSSAMANAGTITTATNFMDEVRVFVTNGPNSGTITLQAAANGAGTLTIQPASGCQMIGQ